MFEADELRLILDALSGKKMTTTTADDETDERQRDRKLPNPVIRATAFGFVAHPRAIAP